MARHVLVAGAAVTGRSVVAALLERGDDVTVTDADASRLESFAEFGARLEQGLTEPPAGTDLVITSPGWRPSSPLLVAAADAGVEVIGDIEFAWRLSQERPKPPVWLAVTGTNGKTTTVSMLESILRASGANAVACGNVGFAVLDAVREGFDVLAVELSSFQLHWSSTLAPAAAAVLNVAEDHIDWHGSMDAYAADKGKILAGAGTAVVNADDAWSRKLLAPRPEDGSTASTTTSKDGTTCRRPLTRAAFTLGTPERGQFGVAHGHLVDNATEPAAVELCAVEDVRPPGPHNVANALAAAALARAYGVSAADVREGLRTFTPVDHRAAPVADVDGVHYVNDSKATNPHAASGSLLTHEHVVWIAGGLLKGAEVDELVQQVAGRLRAVVLLGTDADVIAAAVGRHAPDVRVIRVDSGDDETHARRAEDYMTAAVQAAHSLARPGDAVVLAPAAASMDMFRDYAHRGAAFTDAVHALTAGESSDGSA